MTLDNRTLAIILAMTAAAAFCRYAGFAFMRFVPMTPRVRAGLDAIPLAVMLGIIIPPALRGGVPELTGIAVTALAVLLRLNELVAIVCGMAAVAALRASGL
jgi:uncharacterized membrane protein